MDRQIVYPGAIPLDTDLLNVQRNVMIAEGFLAQAMVGNGPIANGLACVPTGPASMVVNIGPGMIAAQETVDASAFGSVALDTSDNLVKVGINLSTIASSTLGTISAPGTTGQSVVYLISAAFSETDTSAVVLPYYNASNPTVAYSGPNNTGSAQNTQRIQRASLTLTAGTPATTGSQTVPATPAGNVALWTITVAHTDTTITSGAIAAAPGAPFIGGGSLLPGRLLAVQSWTNAGSHTYTPTPGTNTRIWEVRGGAASGGGAAATSSADIAAGSGGGSGAFTRHKESAGITTAAIVVGAGGAAPAAGANNGNDGSASSVTATGFTLNAPGGGHGLGTASQSGSFITGGGAPGAVATGGNLLNATGDQGGASFGIIAGSNFYLVSGDGGEAEMGGGGASVGNTTAGVAGSTPGAGGSGAASGGTGTGGTAQAGGAGAAGGVWVWEFS